MPASSRLSSSAFAAALACAAMAAAPASARGGDELTVLINAYRSAPGACAGRPARPAAPLAPEAALAKVGVGEAEEVRLVGFGPESPRPPEEQPGGEVEPL